ncbi:hypothetical protein [Burkholderia gladioli]|uniref:hypothetical protein n=1 Tax=Burkholderia gladioli TaxID=28095 RepID=UPI001FC80EA7|nr:hypothetical protein [Burkholderia gladioli]MDN7723423.1 hypothetical protein [Burkholderia gladioli]
MPISAPTRPAEVAAAAPAAVAVAAALPATALRVRALGYRRVAAAPGPASGAWPLARTARELGALAAAERERVAGAARADDYVISSTILSMLLMNGSAPHRAFVEAAAGAHPRRPDWITCSYECAGWGYVLRRALDKAAVSGPHTLLLQLLDVDLHGYAYWHGNPAWGASGFGLATLLIEVDRPGPHQSLIAGAAPPANAVVQLGRTLRGFCAERPGLRAAIPFFPAQSRRAMLATLGNTPLMPDGHARFGHAFGSDPWISLLLAAEQEGAPARAVVCSLALNGYYAIGDVAFAPDARFTLAAEPPSAREEAGS